MARRHHFAWFAVLLPLVGGVQDAAAQGTAVDTALQTRPVTVGDYRMRVVWDPDRDPSVVIAQRRGNSLQRHEWYVTKTFELAVSDDLSSGHVRARFAVGGYIDMRFGASGPVSHTAPGFQGRFPRCFGNRMRRAGSLVGTLRLPTGA